MDLPRHLVAHLPIRAMCLQLMGKCLSARPLKGGVIYRIAIHAKPRGEAVAQVSKRDAISLLRPYAGKDGAHKGLVSRCMRCERVGLVPSLDEIGACMRICIEKVGGASGV